MYAAWKLQSQPPPPQWTEYILIQLTHDLTQPMPPPFSPLAPHLCHTIAQSVARSTHVALPFSSGSCNAAAAARWTAGLPCFGHTSMGCRPSVLSGFMLLCSCSTESGKSPFDW